LTNFADDCVKNTCNTSSIAAYFFLVLNKIMLKNLLIPLVKTGSYMILFSGAQKYSLYEIDKKAV